MLQKKKDNFFHYRHKSTAVLFLRIFLDMQGFQTCYDVTKIISEHQS